MPGRRAWTGLVLAGAALLVALAILPGSAPVFHWLFPQLERPLYERVGFLELTTWHVLLVAGSTAAATLLGLCLAILVTRAGGRRAKPLVLAVAAVSQTFPPVAVLAVAIPMLGYGGAPTFLALFAYALLPIVLNAVAALEGVDRGVLESADAMGMSTLQRLWQIELPMAGPVALAGIRTAAIINVGTATVGSTAGAATLGSPILDGLSAYNTAYVLQGALLVTLLAVVIDQAFAVGHGIVSRIGAPERATSARSATDPLPRSPAA